MKKFHNKLTAEMHSKLFLSYIFPGIYGDCRTFY